MNEGQVPGQGQPQQGGEEAGAEEGEGSGFPWALALAGLALLVAVVALVGAIVTNEDKASEGDVTEAVIELEEAVETAIGGQVETAAELDTASRQAGKKVAKQQEVSRDLDRRVADLEAKVDQQGKDISSLQGSVEQLNGSVKSLQSSVKAIERDLRRLTE